ncbi:hypothetical protein [Labrys okinawensis]|uniref:hypothetical protein n=1 Tax=Labrys okinawensis TaxID=346911 RepID=UPI0011B2226F|nr:hypothetical protein [Labrys okinawensis]
MSVVNLAGDLTAGVSLQGGQSPNSGSVFNLGGPGNVVSIVGFFEPYTAYVDIKDDFATDITVVNLNYKSINIDSYFSISGADLKGRFYISSSANIELNADGVSNFSNRDQFSVFAKGSITFNFGNGTGYFENKNDFYINNLPSKASSDLKFNFKSFRTDGGWSLRGYFGGASTNIYLANNSKLEINVGEGDNSDAEWLRSICE